MARASPVKTNSRGASMQPCLIPLCGQIHPPSRLSISCLPWIKANWRGLTSSPITSLNLLTKTFAMTRWIELDREIGQKSPTLAAPRDFGRRKRCDLLSLSRPHDTTTGGHHIHFNHIPKHPVENIQAIILTI